MASHVPHGVDMFFQSENGLIRTGAVPEEGFAHPRLTDAGGKPVSTLPLTSVRAVDMIATEMAVIVFNDGRLKLLETAGRQRR